MSPALIVSLSKLKYDRFCAVNNALLQIKHINSIKFLTRFQYLFLRFVELKAFDQGNNIELAIKKIVSFLFNHYF
ncbi:MAG TPA: hypothetical protein DF603_14005 [Chryseobacterium sp.]|nr:hypothetical protein [Chryseobacterium sp.]